MGLLQQQPLIRQLFSCKNEIMFTCLDTAFNKTIINMPYLFDFKVCKCLAIFRVYCIIACMHNNQTPIIKLLLILFLFTSFSIFADDKSTNTITVDSFDGPGSGGYYDGSRIIWNAVGSRYATRFESENPGAPENFPRLAYADRNAAPDIFGTLPEPSENSAVLGIWSRFDRPGYNSYEILPGETSEGEWIYRPIELVQKVKSISFLAWGSDLDYEIEIHIMDTNGFVYQLRPFRTDTANGKHIESSLKYTGWAEFSAKIPDYIIQRDVAVSNRFPLYISKFVVRTMPEEKISECRLYLDRLEVITIPAETLDGLF